MGGVRQYRKKRILSVIYILEKIRKPARYKNGIDNEYSMMMKVVAMIDEYLSASSISGPVYNYSYSCCSTF